MVLTVLTFWIVNCGHGMDSVYWCDLDLDWDNVSWIRFMICLQLCACFVLFWISCGLRSKSCILCMLFYFDNI